VNILYVGEKKYLYETGGSEGAMPLYEGCVVSDHTYPLLKEYYGFRPGDRVSYPWFRFGEYEEILAIGLDVYFYRRSDGSEGVRHVVQLAIGARHYAPDTIN